MSVLPAEFVSRLRAQFGEQAESVLGTFCERPMVVRINLLTSSPAEVETGFREAGAEVRELAGVSYGRIVYGIPRRAIIDHPLVQQGKAYIQSHASMLCVHALNPQPGEAVLDLCAAPGSKTGQIAMLMRREGELVANEPSRSRFFKLKAVLERVGAFTEQGDFLSLHRADGAAHRRRFADRFDRVLVDAPCSGEARFIEEQPETYQEWSPRRCSVNASLQKKLLGAAVQMTKPGGTIVYSTCTLNQRENEEIVEWCLKKFGAFVTLAPVTVPAQTFAASSGSEWVRLSPTTLTEPFFIAKFVRNGTPATG